MGSYRSKEDDVGKISTSIYVTNFPESITANELFQSCTVYGHVVDSFIPNKRAKNGKRFGFVRFINVFRVDRLASNLCTVWIKSHKLQANAAKFQRAPINGSSKGGSLNVNSMGRKMEGKNQSKTNVKVDSLNRGGGVSFAKVVKRDVNKGVGETEPKSGLVLEDECLVSKNLVNTLMVRVKEFASLANLKMTLANEGFMEKRIAWVEVEGIPLKLWSDKTFRRITFKWGELLDVDDHEDSCFHSKRLCIHTKFNKSIEEDFKVIYRGAIYWVRAKETMGWVLNFAEEPDVEEQEDFDAIVEGVKEQGRIFLKREKLVVGGNDDDKGSFTSGHFKISEIPRTEGSFLGILDEVIKVGKVMGYKMKGCGILCVWDSNLFAKESHTVSDSFVITRGTRRLTGQKFMVVTVYAPQNDKEKLMLWEFLQQEIGKWEGEVVLMGDFNEVRCKADRFGTCFNEKGARSFNLFIENSGIMEIALGGCHFMWCHKNATKMNGVWVDDPRRVKYQFLEQFSNRFCKPSNKVVSIQMNFLKKILDEQSKNIEREISNDEIKTAVWDCGTEKAPGLDGFTFGFFRRFWHVIQDDVIAAVRYFFLNFDIPKGCNSSFIALIPKTPNANMVNDFRPISLIGSVYKIIAKILANRLVGVLDGIVDEVQSAFISNRQILDGPFILNEVLQRSKWKKKQALIFKVDFEKAYDSVRWDFLEEVLRKFGFGDKWCKWIKCCLTSSRGSIIVNGSPTEEFQFGKGLKHGDPLSPFLFILIMKSLHISFQRVVDVGMFKGISLGGGTVNLSHMFFADDAVFVGLRIDLGVLSSTLILCIWDRLLEGKMAQINTWRDTMEKVKKRLSNWKMNMLSIGGLTLVKSVLGSMPLYQFSLFKVPMGVLNYIETLRRRFLNGCASNNKKAIWMNWKNALAPKDRGGLGISSLYAMNRGYFLNGYGIFSLKKRLCGLELSRPSTGNPRGGLEMDQLANLKDLMKDVSLNSNADSVHIPVKNKSLLEGVFQVMWWLLWYFRNKTIFEAKVPRKALFFDEVVYDGVATVEEGGGSEVWQRRRMAFDGGYSVVGDTVEMETKVMVVCGDEDSGGCGRSLAGSGRRRRMGRRETCEDEDFKSKAWVSTTNYVNANEGTVIGCLGDIKNFLKNKKLDEVVAIVKSCSTNAIGDLTVTMKDLSGTISETIHYKVIGDGGFGKDITSVSQLVIMAMNNNGDGSSGSNSDVSIDDQHRFSNAR
nr:RNA-directed DNA polymerase, eukaryota [Tanacetum cinerariifolium]